MVYWKQPPTNCCVVGSENNFSERSWISLGLLFVEVTKSFFTEVAWWDLGLWQLKFDKMNKLRRNLDSWPLV